jgi:hypothetical protein
MMAWLNSSKTTTMSKKSLHQELNASVLKSWTRSVNAKFALDQSAF